MNVWKLVSGILSIILFVFFKKIDYIINKQNKNHLNAFYI